MNSVNLVGRLTADPDMRYTQQGAAVASFTIAVRRRFKNQSTGEYDSDFIRCQAWKNTAEVIANNFSKGRMIGVAGTWRTGSFDGQDGKKVYTNDCIVEYITFIDSSGASGGSEGRGNTNRQGGNQNASEGKGNDDFDPFQNNGRTIDIDDDSLPF
ncbi:putative single stranded DNA-binding protein [Bacillus phage vB_BspS_SplendidRed]|uniref:Single-stranded DNA-binding protein n=1 Tax=Bacillus phage vB_BspS_SplendidRed TaxID=2591379 RepID=A0A5B9NH25_9CAUD|nr:putative single stranded DNA-binding protein [Bacillus phage vB_BspS_SplendidRed]QEG13504.1 putative single stranded DNA-binding protein [Bacillus phage vB_BspS_SplendidRed]